MSFIHFVFQHLFVEKFSYQKFKQVTKIIQKEATGIQPPSSLVFCRETDG